jgi:hypothetical protein
VSAIVETVIKDACSQRPLSLRSPRDYLFLLDRVEREAQAAEEEARKRAHARAWELAKQQGVKPIRSIEDLQGDFWPEEESVDEFLDWVREMRQQDKPRSELE